MSEMDDDSCITDYKAVPCNSLESLVSDSCHNDDSDDEDKRQADEHLMLLQAVAFIEDAFYYRSIHHKVDRHALMVSGIYNSKAVEWIRHAVIIVIHFLAFLEFPSSLSWSSDLSKKTTDRYEFPCGSLHTIEIICILAFCVDIGLKTYLIGRYNAIRSKWIVAYAVVLAISLIDWILTLCLQCTEHVRIRRYLRPFFIVQNSNLMKKMVNCLRRTIPEVVSVLLLLFLHLFMFTLFGMLLFHIHPHNHTMHQHKHANSTEGEEYFRTLFQSMLSLLVLLTTANNPDVTMPAYSKNRLYQIYFFLYLIIGLFCFMNMLTAVIYNQFRGYFLNSMQSSLFRRRVAIRAAYEMLCRQSFRHGSQINVTSNIVDRKHLIAVVRRCKINKDKKQALLEELNQKPDTVFTCVQFQQLFCILDTDTAKAALPLPEPTRFHRLRWLQLFILHRAFAYIGNIVAITNVIFIAVELSNEYTGALGSKHSTLRLVNLIFIIYYLLEQSIKVWAYGLKRYISVRANFFDGIITIVLVVIEIAYLIEFGGAPFNSDNAEQYIPSEAADILWNLVRFINILITLRLLRIISNIKAMYVVANTLLDLLGSMTPFGGIVVAIYYVFAILGLELFNGRIEYHVNSTKTGCGTYQQLNYWANNFDDFASSIVVLWDIMVVNNWHVFLQAYAEVTTKWSYLYFICWWLLSVIIVLNLFTALILENFIMKWDRSNQSISDQSESLAHFNTLHDMFRDGLREPSEQELLVEIRHHRYLVYS